MRIVGGTHKGATLAAPKSRATRPTSDRTREALFNILEHGVAGFSLSGARVLDLFAGTGALGLEALSRGAKFCLFVEDAAEARALIRRNVETLKATGSSKIWRRDATKLGLAAQLGSFDLVFADPPYGRGLGEAALLSALDGGWLSENALCVLEEEKRTAIAPVKGLTLTGQRTYGDTQLVLFRKSVSAPPE